MKSIIFFILISSVASFANAMSCEDFNGRYARLAFPDDEMIVEQKFLFEIPYFRLNGFSPYPKLNSVHIKANNSDISETLPDGSTITYRASCSRIKGTPVLELEIKEPDVNSNFLIFYENDRSGLFVYMYTITDKQSEESKAYFFAKK